MGKEKCRACKHYKIQYSYLLKANIECCDLDGTYKGKSCRDSFELKKDKEPPKAFIKVRKENNDETDKSNQ